MGVSFSFLLGPCLSLLAGLARPLSTCKKCPPRHTPQVLTVTASPRLHTNPSPLPLPFATRESTITATPSWHAGPITTLSQHGVQAPLQTPVATSTQHGAQVPPRRKL
ncbi:hypothetical protein EDB89DRAFT_1942943 [Lactarius sanguifluus]|nr:hypothetical protein EDB89DRAFT_2051140 [Lactarius sanguifluus]KAH9175963.1 hypothetical protein EDB89DRAFT_1942943 [Lactarius sanguifluus]